MTPPLMAESKEDLKSLLMKVKEESGKVGLKLNIRKMKIIASSPITSWEIDGEIMKTVTDFIFLGCKITADGDCSHEIKTCLLLGRKVMTNLDSILKSRDITLLTKVCLVKAMVFPESCMDVRVGPWRKLSSKELMLLNCGFGEDSWESLGLLLLSRFSHVRLCVRPHRWAAHQSPPSLGFSRQEHWSSWVAISFSNTWKWKVKLKSLSHLTTPWTAPYQAPPSVGFSRQEYWSGLPLQFS